MAIRKVVKEGDELLRKKSKPVKTFDRELWNLLDDMWDTMYANDGMGLAAVQVGILRRAIVIDVNGLKAELINPEIYYEEGEDIDEEGCLSVVGFNGNVKRPYKIKVRAFDRYGFPFALEGEKYLARCVCHECDHLEGILYIDKCDNRNEYFKRRRK